MPMLFWLPVPSPAAHTSCGLCSHPHSAYRSRLLRPSPTVLQGHGFLINTLNGLRKASAILLNLIWNSCHILDTDAVLSVTHTLAAQCPTPATLQASAALLLRWLHIYPQTISLMRTQSDTPCPPSLYVSVSFCPQPLTHLSPNTEVFLAGRPSHHRPGVKFPLTLQFKLVPFARLSPRL